MSLVKFGGELGRALKASRRARRQKVWMNFEKGSDQG